MSSIGNEYPEEWYSEINFDCGYCDEVNEDVETLVSGGYTEVKCKKCGKTNTFDGLE